MLAYCKVKPSSICIQTLTLGLYIFIQNVMFYVKLYLRKPGEKKVLIRLDPYESNRVDKIEQFSLLYYD